MRSLGAHSLLLAASLSASLVGCCLGVVSGEQIPTGTGGSGSTGIGPSSSGSANGSSSGGISSGTGTSGVTVIASNQAGACGLCVDSQNVYWQTSSTISMAPLGGGAVTILASGLPGPAQVACDGANVYWTDNSDNTINRVAIGGGGPIPLARNPSQAFAIAVQAGVVYWGNHDGTLFSVLVDGQGENQILAGNDGSEVWSIWPTETELFFTDHTSGEVRQASLGGPAWSTVGVSTGGAGDLAGNGHVICWSCGEAGGSLNEVPEGGGASQVLATGQNGILGVAMDDANVYWVNLFGGQVAKMDLATGAMTTIASGRQSPCMIALSATRAYWTDAAGVLSAPK